MTSGMERVAVQSREIALLGYDAGRKMLEVTFRRGGVYHYQNVPVDIYQALLQAPSIGTFFSEKIRNQYPFEKVK